MAIRLCQTHGLSVQLPGKQAYLGLRPAPVSPGRGKTAQTVFSRTTNQASQEAFGFSLKGENVKKWLLAAGLALMASSGQAQIGPVIGAGSGSVCASDGVFGSYLYPVGVANQRSAMRLIAWQYGGTFAVGPWRVVDAGGQLGVSTPFGALGSGWWAVSVQLMQVRGGQWVTIDHQYIPVAGSNGGWWCPV